PQRLRGSGQEDRGGDGRRTRRRPGEVAVHAGWDRPLLQGVSRASEEMMRRTGAGEELRRPGASHAEAEAARGAGGTGRGDRGRSVAAVATSGSDHAGEP